MVLSPIESVYIMGTLILQARHPELHVTAGEPRLFLRDGDGDAISASQVTDVATHRSSVLHLS